MDRFVFIEFAQSWIIEKSSWKQENILSDTGVRGWQTSERLLSHIQEKCWLWLSVGSDLWRPKIPDPALEATLTKKGGCTALSAKKNASFGSGRSK